MIIRMRHEPFVDTAGLTNLKEGLKNLIHADIRVILSGVNENVAADLENFNIFKLIGKDSIFPVFDDALEYAKTHVSEKKGKDFQSK